MNSVKQNIAMIKAAQAAAMLGQLGQTQFGQQKDVLQALSTAGSQQQGLEQQRLSQLYQDFQNQRQYPYQQLGYFSDMLRGLPMSQTTQSIYAAPPSMGAQLAGAGTAYLGAKQAGLFAEGGVTGLALYNMSKDES
jgi:hypothetical protein